MMSRRAIGVLAVLAGSACGGTTRVDRAPRSSEPAVAPVVSVQAESETAPDDDDAPVELFEPAPAPGGERASAAAQPTDPKPLEGPYATLDDYRREHPPGHDPSCGALQKPTAPPKRLGGHGRISEARLLRLPDSFACGPMEYCLLALRTGDGWFVRRTEEPCQGVIGPGKKAHLSDVSSRWVDTGDGWALAIEETRAVTSLEVSDDRGTKREASHEHESRYMTLCGLGPSGTPSCTEALVVSCPKFDGTNSEVAWSVAEGNLHLESAADPASACDMDGPFVVGDYRLKFP